EKFSMSAIQKKTAKTVDAIRKLLSSRYIVRAKNQKAFQAIYEQQKYLESYFDAAGANLIINETLGVAYLEANPDDDATCNYAFGRVQSLTAAETFGLILLRQQRNDYYTSPEENENPILDEDKFKEAVSSMLTSKTD